MSQAQVTDFFSQSKKGGIDRVLRGKEGQNTPVSVDTVPSRVVVVKKQNARATRSKSETKFRTATVRSTRSKKCLLEELKKSPEKVANEATSVDEVTVSTTDVAPAEPVEQTSESPRTPKRNSSETEFDLGSALFSVTAGHSSAKKRLRVELAQEANTTPESRTPNLKIERSARKKLVLLKDGEQAPRHTDKPTSRPTGRPLPNDKETKSLVNCSGSSSPTGCPQQTVPRSKTFSKEDVVALKSRLQKIQDQGKHASLPPTGPRPTFSEIKGRLARARELGERAQSRKEEKLAQKAQSANEETGLGAKESENVPAYERYHTLAQDVPPGLSLPYKYKVLAEMFRSMDTIVGMLFNRSETVTFAKVKQAVQDMIHKRFEESHVGQIKTVYPSAYTFRQERNIPTFSATANKSSYQLTMEPDIEKKSGVRPLLSASCLLERRRIFHRNLVDVVKQHHKVFLASVNPALSVPDDKLTRWHPRFSVDEVPNILASELPLPPQTEKMTTAQEVLDKARSLMTPKMEKALANIALKTAETASTHKEQKPPPKMTQPPPSSLKGVSQSLLERIRAKEAQKVQAAMTRNPKQEERLRMISRLGEMARILRNVFVAEKKQALIMEVACSRMVASYRSTLSTGEMERHLRLLAELTPEWLTIHPIRTDFYLKLDKRVDLSTVLEKVNRQSKEEEKL